MQMPPQSFNCFGNTREFGAVSSIQHSADFLFVNAQLAGKLHLGNTRIAHRIITGHYE